MLPIFMEVRKPVTHPVHEPPRTWEARLASGLLKEEEWKVLRDMVESGEADSLEDAARLLDFKERDLNQEDSFYGF
ncbi:MAG: hypothetical protein D6775_09005 [Caldilineae bacterium]|nr:MAG: hypothetical protein D6775_09005 [Caldilineae bacterium]